MGTLSSLTGTEAWRIGSAIRNALLDDGKQANICVVNRDGHLLLELAMDNTRPFTATVARLKAQQSARTWRRTRWIRDQVKANELTPYVLGIPKDEFIAWAGGIPTYTPDGKTLLGAAGVSNLAEDDDEKFCAYGVEVCGFSSDRDAPAAYGEIGNIDARILFTHHVGIGLPYREMVELAVHALTQRGARVVAQKDGPKYFLRLNPWDEVLLEIFLETGQSVNFHVDQAVSNFAALQAVAHLFKDYGVPGMLFQQIFDEKAEGSVSADIAFSQR